MGGIVLLFLLLGFKLYAINISKDPKNNQPCVPVFANTHLRVPEKVSAINLAIASKWTIEHTSIAKKLPDSSYEIDGIPANYIGMLIRSEAECFFTYTRDGVARYIKVLSAAGKGYIDDASTFSGLKLGEIFGAPKILRFGEIRFENTGEVHYFIETHEFAPGKKKFSLKKEGIRGRDQKKALILIKGDEKTRPSKQIADKFVETLEYGVMPVDPDFLITEDGKQVTWIDTSLWMYIKNDPPTRRPFYDIFDYFYMFGDIFSNGNKIAFTFIYDFLKSLRASTILTTAQKEDFLKKCVLSKKDDINVRKIYFASGIFTKDNQTTTLKLFREIDGFSWSPE